LTTISEIVTFRFGVQPDWKMPMTDPLSATFHALADPVRRDILARLALGEETPKELAKPYPITLSAVSKHLKIMEEAGLISRRRESQWRPCRLEADALRRIDKYLEDYRCLREDGLDRLDVYVQKIKQKEQRNARNRDPE
jgi:DNA-binding transcriptional ArsR family regulator